MFTITITSTNIEEKPAGKEWEITGEENPKYAYTPEIMKRREVELKIYEQTVDEIDIKSVIAAVNRVSLVKP